MRFFVLVTGYNCENYIDNCYMSLLKQTYNNFYSVFISDGSTDLTASKLKSINDSRFTTEATQVNYGAAYIRYNAIRKYCKDKEDVVCLLGMDDELKPNALEIVKTQYDHGKWMTYGNWIDNNGYSLPDKFKLDFPDHVHKKRSYRHEIYRSTAMNTFKRFLFDRMNEDDFKVNGSWIKATTESNIMFSCMEMSGKNRIGVVRDKIYLYNRRGSMSTVSYRGREYQDFIYNNIINRPKKELLNG
jgi:Predicted glycosyltransferases